MEKRKRITTIEKSEEKSIVEENEFKTNSASKNAKLIHIYNDIEIEIWIDKHYENRVNFGDESGKRKGIEQYLVQHLIIDSVKYIFHFYLNNRISNFINFPDKKNPIRNNRIIIKDFRDSEVPLNIAIEIHFITYGKYEITVLTAMKTNDMKIHDSQYCISLIDSGVNLNRMENNTLRKLETIKIEQSMR
jgi:hypothetical protein